MKDATSVPRYSFAALSDIHIDLENGGKNTYFVNAEKNLSLALGCVRRRGCSFIISAGDQVTNASGAKDEWRRYREIITQSGYTGMIFEAVGNHELRLASHGGCSIKDALDEFITMTKLSDKPVLREEGRAYYEYLEPLLGDSFIFMAQERGFGTNSVDNFTDDQTDWVEALIEKRLREGRRIFLIQHANLYRFGAGDDREHPCYEGAARLTGHDGRPFENNLRFKALTERYRDLIWLSGHTHVDLRDDVNYSNEDGRSCHMLHIPSVANTTRLRHDGEEYFLDRRFYDDTTQGYIADVYADRVIFRGINFFYDRLYPAYTYEILKSKK